MKKRKRVKMTWLWAHRNTKVFILSIPSFKNPLHKMFCGTLLFHNISHKLCRYNTKITATALLKSRDLHAFVVCLFLFVCLFVGVYFLREMFEGVLGVHQETLFCFQNHRCRSGLYVTSHLISYEGHHDSFFLERISRPDL